jgi:hypothetical protein
VSSCLPRCTYEHHPKRKIRIEQVRLPIPELRRCAQRWICSKLIDGVWKGMSDPLIFLLGFRNAPDFFVPLAGKRATMRLNKPYCCHSRFVLDYGGVMLGSHTCEITIRTLATPVHKQSWRRRISECKQCGNDTATRGSDWLAGDESTQPSREIAELAWTIALKPASTIHGCQGFKLRAEYG